MHISFRHTFFALGTLIAFIFIIYIGDTILIPLAFALLISLILYPLVKWLVKKGFNLVWAIITVMFTVILANAGIIYFFSSQIISISREYDSFLNKLSSLYHKVIAFVNYKIQIFPRLESEDIKSKLMQTLSESGLPIVSDTISFTGTFLSYLVLTLIYIFLILLYHKIFANALTMFAKESDRPRFYSMLKETQKVGQKYLTGMALLMLILGVLNTTGLLILGIDYAFFFGFLAALLAIVPYIGTALGGLLPTIYAFMTYDSYWYPIGVILIFWGVQFIEGNFLSPKIVGGNLNLNAMTALISLIAGGVLWGIAGMILFLPLAAIFKVICDHYDELRPLAMLMEDNKRDKDPGLFRRLFNKARS